jgi:hypothetical protein
MLDQAKRQPRSRPRPRAKRPQRSPRRQVDPAVADAALEEALRRSPLARNTLETSESLALARLAEQVTAWGLEAVEQTLTRVSRQLAAAEGQVTPESIRAAESLRLRLIDAEADAVRWRRQLAAHRDQRERAEVMLKMHAEAL